MAEESQQFLAFVTDEGMYEFSYVPFGLNVAGHKLMRKLNKLLGGFKDVYGYSEDWLIASASLEEHTKTLNAVFEALTEARDVLKAGKCSFYFHQ